MIQPIQDMHAEDKANFEAMLMQLAEQPGFSEAQWDCISDITCGSTLFDPTSIRNILGTIQDAEASYFDKWEVSRADILGKFAKLDSLSRLAVAVRCRSLLVE